MRLLAAGTAVSLAAASGWRSPGAQAFQPDPRRSTVRVTAARDPAWAPSGAQIALSLYDQVWVMGRDGQGARPVAAWPRVTEAVERDPAWSPDGRHLAFAADLGQGFDLFITPATGGPPRRLTYLPGDERWPSWTPDGRLVFAAHVDRQWDLYRVASLPPTGTADAPEPVTETPGDETEPRVSPDGRAVAYISTDDTDDGEADLWVMSLTSGLVSAANGRVTGEGTPVRVVRARGAEWSPSWAPAGDRLAFGATRGSLGSIWVIVVDTAPDRSADNPASSDASPVLVSRQGGQVAWSPDGRTLLVTDAPDREPGYNGDPQRDAREAAALFALGRSFGARFLPAPLPPDSGDTPLTARLPSLAHRLLPAFDRAWDTLRGLYYTTGPAAARWQALRQELRPLAAQARDEAALEAVVDRLVAQQPLVRHPVTSSRAIVVSGHTLASQAGARVLERGGNVVDAAVAVSFTLGVVEPDASGIGGDGMALVFLNGMTEPVIVDFKDQTPIHATLDNPAIFRGGRLVESGPAAANIPGLVAGLDLLHRRFGSGRVAWADVIEPAIRHAEDGFILDESFPTTLAEGRSLLSRYDAARELLLPAGRIPKAGDRFVNRDYAATLRAIAARGAREFYQGEIARQIARDMAEHGGIISAEDLAQYRALERAPVTGRFRDLLVFSTPPPVSSGAALIESLQILDGSKPPARSGAVGAEAHSADYLHLLIESWKARHAPRVADPALWPVDLAPHLDSQHAAELFAQIHRERAGTFRDPATDRDGALNDDGAPPTRLGSGTSAFVVADVEGNVVVVTQTLSTWGGSFYVSDGLGFLYNNHLRSSRTGRGAYGQLLPLTRSSSTNAPTLLMRETGGRRTPTLAVAAAGNAWILASVYSIVSGVVDGGLGAQAAVEAPRLLVTRDPADASGASARVQIEDRFPRRVLDDLVRRGHVVQKIGRKGELKYGYASAVAFDVERHTVEAGADPRRSHQAVAVQ